MLSPILAQPLSPSEHKTLAQEIDHALLDQLITRWYPLVIDREKVGFLSTVSYDWKPISYRDSMESTRKAHEYTDHVLFGHDLETAYLMLEASHALGLTHHERTIAIAKHRV